MVNPHWDEEINEDITVTDLPPWSPQQEWGDVGGGGEFKSHVFWLHLVECGLYPVLKIG